VSPGHLAQPAPGLLDPDRVATNFVLFAVAGGLERRTAYLQAMADQGVAMVAYPHGQIRAVTHLGIERADVDRAIEASARALASTTP
jgi:threonine aldolase